MRSVLRCVTVCVILAMAVCFDSEESTESLEDVVMSHYGANTFIKPHRRNDYYAHHWSAKFPHERRAEICEDYFHCRLMARRYGPQLAYQKYFGGRPGNRNNISQRY